ncbi:hypothetical protein [Catellatospora chokoriensis]|uniref:Uncharacterized protein n=1 Tax=Catellatospora chokoriensis TaxID=310353 RepID=A0A8J3K103_9ACTN|nr:hypothetical protein [Catellatospora chokoriensis]GIF90487.1 hypothetical protein Cch02nite_39310 [Catellatospora chokoriensis]
MSEQLRGYDGPNQYTRARAQITDEQLAEGIRDALIAVWWWFDAWWPDERDTANKYSRKLAQMIQDTRDTITARGAAATVDEFVAASVPLLGEAWPSRPSSAAGLSAAIDSLRDAALLRVTSVRRARGEVDRWDGKRVLRTLG